MGFLIIIITVAIGVFTCYSWKDLKPEEKKQTKEDVLRLKESPLSDAMQKRYERDIAPKKEAAEKAIGDAVEGIKKHFD